MSDTMTTTMTAAIKNLIPVMDRTVDEMRDDALELQQDALGLIDTLDELLAPLTSSPPVLSEETVIDLGHRAHMVEVTIRLARSYMAQALCLNMAVCMDAAQQRSETAAS